MPPQDAVPAASEFIESALEHVERRLRAAALEQPFAQHRSPAPAPERLHRENQHRWFRVPAGA